MNKHIISLAGDIASGKGTVSKILSERLNYTIYRNGEYFRSLAKEMNMSIKDFNIYVESHPDIDLKIEQSAKEYAEKNDNILIDARLGWYAVPHSFKVYLKVDLEIAAKRVMQDDSRGSIEKYTSLEEAEKEIWERFKLENERYYKLYNVRKDDMNNYDLVIDTTSLTPNEVTEIIYTKYKDWLKNI